MTEREIIEALGDHMRENGITQERAAEMSGLKQSNIARILNGKYTSNLKTLLRLADAIGASIVVEQ